MDCADRGFRLIAHRSLTQIRFTHFLSTNISDLHFFHFPPTLTWNFRATPIYDSYFVLYTGSVFAVRRKLSFPSPSDWLRTM